MREDGKEVLPHHDAGVYQFFLALSLCHTVEAKVAKSFVSPTSEPHSQGRGLILPLSPILERIRKGNIELICRAESELQIFLTLYNLNRSSSQDIGKNKDQSKSQLYRPVISTFTTRPHPPTNLP